MDLVIIESPYAGASPAIVAANVEYAQRAMRHSLDRGEAPFASHLLYTQPHVLDDSIPKERERGIQAGFEWMQQATLVAFYIDLGWSPGMIKGLKATRLFRKTIAVRSIFSAPWRGSLEGAAGAEVGTILREAGVAVEVSSPIEGTEMCLFGKGDK